MVTSESSYNGYKGVEDRRKTSDIVDMRHLNEMFLDLMLDTLEQRDLVSLRKMGMDSRIYNRLKSMTKREKRRLLDEAGNTPLFKLRFDDELLSDAEERHNKSK